MKAISAPLLAHLQQEVTTLATCWKLTRRDGAVMGFTDHDAALQVEGVSYQAASGFTPTAIESRSGLGVDNLDIEGMLDADSITEADILAGVYDYAEVLIFQVNYEQPESGSFVLRRGWIGEVQVQGGRFVAEIRGLSQKLVQSLGKTYSVSCRASLGDAACGVNLAGWSVTGSVDTVENRLDVLDAARSEPAGYFDGGVMRFTSGANAGHAMEVKRYVTGRMTLALPLPFEIYANDGYTLVAGCDKTLARCATQFSNAVNFRGEPHVPGTDRMLETAGTRRKAS